MSYANLLDINNLRSMLDRRLAEVNKRMRVEYVDDPDECKTASTTADKITIPSPKMPITLEGLDLVYGYGIHETGHHLRPAIWEIVSNLKLPAGHPVYSILNIVEDQSMERQLADRYLGDRKALSRCMSLHIDRQTKLINGMTCAFSEDQVKAAAVYVTAIMSRADWDHMAQLSLKDMCDALPEEVTELVDTLVSEGWIDTIAKVADPHEALSVTYDLYRRLYPEQPNPEEPPPPPEGSCEEGEKGDDSGDDGSVTRVTEDAESEPSDDSGSSSSEGDSDDTDTDGEKAFGWESVSHSSHDGTPEETHPVFTEHDDSEAHVQLLPPAQVFNVKCKEESTQYNVKLFRDKQHATALANKVRIYLQSLKRVRRAADKHDGKLSRSDLYRLGMPPIDKGDWNKRVFYKNSNKLVKDAAIGLLVDWSGSMYGSRMQVAAECAAMLTDVFDKALNVPTFVSGFTSDYGKDGSLRCVNGIVKNFNERIDPETMRQRFEWFSAYTGGNCDADSLVYIYNQLRNRKEQRKIIIVLSDGDPTDGHPASSARQALKHVTEVLCNTCDVELGAIGIKHKGVKNYYKNYRIVFHVDDLNRAVFSLLQELYLK